MGKVTILYLSKEVVKGMNLCTLMCSGIIVEVGP